MFSLLNRRWFFPAILAMALLVELVVSRLAWRTDIQRDPKLGALQVRSGYELLLENSASSSVQPILSYNATSQHNHRLTVDIRNAKLSDESLRLLAILNPPKTAGRLIYAPDPDEPKSSGPACHISFRVEFPSVANARSRQVQIAPPKPEDVFDRSTTRLVHLSSHSPLAIRLSANSSDGVAGPGCRHLISLGSWQHVIGKDLEIAFLSESDSPVTLTLSSPSFESGKDEVESLEIEPLLPLRLATRPIGLRRILQSRDFAGPPPLTLTNLRLASDFLNVELAGMAGVPITERIGGLRWPLLALLDLPLLALAMRAFLLKDIIFLSYSWADKDLVLPIYQRLKQAGLNLWIDRDQLRGGDNWEEKIRREMLKCRRIIIIISHSLDDGGFFLAELGMARAIAKDRLRRDSFLIPVRLENVPLPPILAPWNAINLFAPDGERRLFEDLGLKYPTAPSAVDAD